MSPKIDRRILKTKNSIKEAFKELLQRKKYSNITVRELADCANITRKTFYLHYNTLSDVVEEMITERSKVLTDYLSEINFLSENFDFKSVVERIHNYFMDNGAFYKKILEDSNSYFIFKKIIDSNETSLAKQYQNEYQLEPEELKLRLRFMMSGMVSTYLSWLNNPEHMPFSKYSNVICSNFDCLISSLSQYKITENPN